MKEKNLEMKYENSSSISAIYPSFYLVSEDYNLKSKKVIDLGCSDWRYLKHFWKWSCWVEYSSIDVKNCIKKWFNVVKWNLNSDFDFFENENFDFMFSSHVIEHLESPYLFLKKIRKYWWENAKLILWYPQEHSLVRLFDPYFEGHSWHIYSFSLGGGESII